MPGKKGRSGGHNRIPLQLVDAKNVRPGRRNPDAPKIEPADPEAPEYLAGRALELWQQYVDLIGTKGTGALSLDNVDALAAMCQAIARLEDAERDIAERGRVLEFEWPKTYRGEPILLPDGEPVMEGKAMANPAVSEASQLHGHIRGWVGLFGLTPADRGRVTVPKRPAANDPLAGRPGR